MNFVGYTRLCCCKHTTIFFTSSFSFSSCFGGGSTRNPKKEKSTNKAFANRFCDRAQVKSNILLLGPHVEISIPQHHAPNHIKRAERKWNFY